MKTIVNRNELRKNRMEIHIIPSEGYYFDSDTNQFIEIDREETENYMINTICLPYFQLIKNGLNYHEAILEIIKKEPEATEWSMTNFLSIVFDLDNLEEIEEMVKSGEAKERLIDSYPWRYELFYLL